MIDRVARRLGVRHGGVTEGLWVRGSMSLTLPLSDTCRFFNSHVHDIVVRLIRHLWIKSAHPLAEFFHAAHGILDMSREDMFFSPCMPTWYRRRRDL